MAKIFFAEDDLNTCDSVQAWLEAEGHTVDVATDGKMAARGLEASDYDLLIIDWLLPGLAGPQICKLYRSSGGNAPILMLTGKKTIDDKQEGFESGADDYLTKPFDPRELSMRVNALLSRPAELKRKILKAGPLELDCENRSVTKNGQPLKLTAGEFNLLCFLMENPGKVFSPQALLNLVWGADSSSSESRVRTCLKTLRKKLDSGNGPPIIENVHSVGYRMAKTDS